MNSCTYQRHPIMCIQMQWMFSSNQPGPMRIWVPSCLSCLGNYRMKSLLRVDLLISLYYLWRLLVSITLFHFLQLFRLWRCCGNILVSAFCSSFLEYWILLGYFDLLWTNSYDFFYHRHAHSFWKAGPEISFLFKNLPIVHYILECFN